MSDSCPVLTPEQRRIVEIIENAERGMWEAISAAIEAAHAQVSEGMRSAGAVEPTPPPAYFASVAHQKLFLQLCGADVETMTGGDPEIASRIIENAQNIRRHYWAGEEEQPGRPQPADGL